MKTSQNILTLKNVVSETHTHTHTTVTPNNITPALGRTTNPVCLSSSMTGIASKSLPRGRCKCVCVCVWYTKRSICWQPPQHDLVSWHLVFQWHRCSTTAVLLQQVCMFHSRSNSVLTVLSMIHGQQDFSFSFGQHQKRTADCASKITVLGCLNRTK